MIIVKVLERKLIEKSLKATTHVIKKNHQAPSKDKQRPLPNSRGVANSLVFHTRTPLVPPNPFSSCIIFEAYLDTVVNENVRTCYSTNVSFNTTNNQIHSKL